MQFGGLNESYIYNDTNSLTFNETKLNATILANDIWVNESGAELPNPIELLIGHGHLSDLLVLLRESLFHPVGGVF